MDVIIFGGQSNMCGETEAVPIDNEPVSCAYEYHYETDSLETLKHPVGEDLFAGMLQGSDKKRGSLVPAFCRAYTRDTGRTVVAVHAACGATAIEQWLPATERFQCMSKKIERAFEKIAKTHTIDKVFYVWLQGESDALRKTTAEDYLQRLILYKNELKKRWNIQKFGVIKVGYFAVNAGWVEGEKEEKRKWDEVIMSAQEQAVAIDNDFIMLTDICPILSMKNEYINPNVSGHYTNEGLDIIGTEAGKALALLNQ